MSVERREYINSHKDKYVIFDIDGVLARWVNAHLPDHHHQGEMFAFLSSLKKKNVGISVLTNRPPGQMPLLAYQLGVDYGWWVAESGGTIYDVRDHRAYVVPQWQEFAKTKVPFLRSCLKEKLGVEEIPFLADKPQFEPGMGLVKTVVLPPKGMTSQDFGENFVVDVVSKSGLDDEFTVNIGKAVDIDPRGLSKGKGMAVLLKINDIDPQKTPALFIADHRRDLEAAEFLHQKGGKVAAVGNADCIYKTKIEELGGDIAPSSTSYHSSVSHLLRNFLK